MDRLEDAQPDLLRALQGKTVVDVKVVAEDKGSLRGFRLLLNDSTAIDVRMKGGQGADGEWYDWLTVTVLGTKQEEQDREVFRG